MLVRVGNTWRPWAHVVLLAGVLTGCSEASEGEAETSSRTSATAEASGQSDGKARSGGTIGAAGSACELPVTFDIAEEWTAEAVENSPSSDGSGETEDELADLVLRQGPVALVCEVDAKPAGNIGYLRVWTGEPGDADARTVLEEFVAADGDVSKERYSSFKSGDLAGVAVDYLYTSELLEETKKESALAVTTPQGPVVLHLGGLDSEEHEAMLPAFELAKSSLSVG